VHSHAIIHRLRCNADVFDALCRGVGHDQARWKPSDDEWSFVEVLNHLADEEVEDFRARVDLTLHRPGEPWTPIDPARWVKDRQYAKRDISESLERFLSRRNRSARWLEALEAPDWSRTGDHPVRGPMSAGELLTSWLAHDYHHIRQLNRLHRQYLHECLSAHPSDYAGEW